MKSDSTNRGSRARKNLARRDAGDTLSAVAKTECEESLRSPTCGPQMWLTLVWHVGIRLPWCWKLGPSYSSERDHVQALLDEQRFPEDTLFCADAGFVGYEFWQAIIDHRYSF